MSPRPLTPLTLEYILLGLLAERSMHGYDLFRELQGRTGLAMIWHVKQSMLYACWINWPGRATWKIKCCRAERIRRAKIITSPQPGG